MKRARHLALFGTVMAVASSGLAAGATVRTEGLLPTDSQSVFVPENRSIFRHQFVPTGVRRIGATKSSTARIDGIDDRVNVDIAIIDSGIDPDQPDLNIVGGINAQHRPVVPFGWGDKFGHGTALGGVAGALDNSFGVVGVAPGARLWAVKVGNGAGGNRELERGLHWVATHADTIEVANVSLEFVRDAKHTGSRDDRRLRRAVNRAVAAGVTVVVAAGNDSANVKRAAPAAYRDAISVSGFSDLNGRSGGPGKRKCEGERDETFFSGSNFGSLIDIAAPAVCLAFPLPNDRIGGGIGTSISAAYVTGVAALYLAHHPGASPARVRHALLAARERGHMRGDPDGIDEGIVNAKPF